MNLSFLRRGLLTCTVLTSVLFSSSGSAVMPRSAPTSVPPSVPVGYTLVGMPLVVQTYNACGPASIAQVLHYFGLPVTLAEVSAATRLTQRSYMSAQAIVSYAPKQNMEARLYTGGSVETVRRAVLMRLPLIVLQNQVYQGKTLPHWRVAMGFDDARKVVYLIDPLIGPFHISYDDFERAWSPHAGLFAALYPPSWRAVVIKQLG